MHLRFAAIPLLIGAMLAGCAARQWQPAADASVGPLLASVPETRVDATQAAQRARALLPVDVLLLGEQHDTPAHHQIQQALVQALAAQGQLAALALEMAPQGGSTTGLPAGASEATVRTALQWDEAAWPWARYGPAVMTAVAAGVPVLGANLPRSQLQYAMKNKALDDHLTMAMWQKQQENIREGHCGLLPESQIIPMTRVQLARDAAMAQTIARALQPGRAVLLIAGNGHVDRVMGVPTHLAQTAPPLRVASVVLTPTSAVADGLPAADATWRTAAPPPRDYCAELREQMPARGPAGGAMPLAPGR